MRSAFRKLNLTAHITSSVGWLGSVVSFLVLSIAGLTSQNAQVVRAAYLAMDLIAWFVIVPLALASLLTGVIQSLGTEWGLFRHYWVLTKLVLTAFATIVLLMKMKLIGQVAGAATATAFAGTDLRQARVGLLVHAGGGLLVLLMAAALSVYKPWGLTRYGRRKRQERREVLARTPISTPRMHSDPARETTGDGVPSAFKIFVPPPVCSRWYSSCFTSAALVTQATVTDRGAIASDGGVSVSEHPHAHNRRRCSFTPTIASLPRISLDHP